MNEPTEAEVERRCNVILKQLEDGKSPDSNELKFLISTNVLLRNFRNPDDGSIGKFAAAMMENVNRKQCVISAEKCEIVPGETILEIGTGSHGYSFEVLLKTKGLKKLVGVEISDSMRDQVSQKFSTEIKTKDLIVVGTDCKDLKEIFPKDESVDCILAINVVYFLHPLREYLKEMYRVLKPCTGRILLSCKESVRDLAPATDEKDTVFHNVDFDHISTLCKEEGFQVTTERIDCEKVSMVSKVSTISDDFILIKLCKI